MIKLVRYGNRKIYNPEQHNYVNLDWIASKISEGSTIQVVCHKTKNDITEKTLARIDYKRACAWPRPSIY